MEETRAPFADAERFSLEEDGVERVWVVLALTEREGKSYALLAPESDLGGGDGDMDVMVCAYHRDDDGNRSLSDVSDEATYDALYQEFVELLGMEPSAEN